jgi:aconitate hydratase
MGVLPLEYKGGDTAASLGLDGTETFDVPVTDDVQPRQEIKVTARKSDASTVTFDTVCRLDTPVDVEYYRNGGILHFVLREFLDRSTIEA